MQQPAAKKNIAIIGGGPSGLFIYKRFTEAAAHAFNIHIYEAGSKLGAGMPYSYAGANAEHITNVSGNEIPELVVPVTDWIQQQPAETLAAYNIDPAQFTPYMVLPRLLFGDYLAAQFEMLQQEGKSKGLQTTVHYNTYVTDVKDIPCEGKVLVSIGNKETKLFDTVVICTGHTWPLTHEGKVPGYFDSPYPPSKLQIKLNHAVAVRGSSLTAIDAIRTIARHNGVFTETAPHKLSFSTHGDAPDFRIVMHSRQGLLPAVRFHLDDPHLSKASLLTSEELAAHIAANGGFLSLDFIFEKDFKETFKEKDPAFYERIKDMDIEFFVEEMMALREALDPFLLFKGEYAEAEKSIKRHQSVYWKEALAILSFAMNYPAKHFSAEDMTRLHKVLMPLISVVIAFVPQSSCEELIALHDAGKLELVPVSGDNNIEVEPAGGIIFHYEDADGGAQAVQYKTFIDSIGQRHLSVENFPFKSLVDDGTIRPAKLMFRSDAAARKMLAEKPDEVLEVGGDYYLKVPGIDITDAFNVVQIDGGINKRIFIMAVPYIGGYNPDYSGLDFCEEASNIIIKAIAAQ